MPLICFLLVNDNACRSIVESITANLRRPKLRQHNVVRVCMQNTHTRPRIYTSLLLGPCILITRNSTSQTLTSCVPRHARPKRLRSRGTTITKITSNVTTPKDHRSATVVKYCQKETKNISFSLSVRKYSHNNAAAYDSRTRCLGRSQVSANGPKFRLTSQIHEWWSDGLAKSVLSLQLYIYIYIYN